jgi:hypothetical protein
MNENRLDSALRLLERVALEICRVPEQMKMLVDQSPGVCVVSFEANPCDTKRLVGDRGSVICALADLLGLMATGSGIKTRVDRMIPNEEPEARYMRVAPDPNADLRPAENLLRDVCEQVFEVPATAHSEIHKEGYSVKTFCHVEGNLEGHPALAALGKAVNVLWVPIGANRGTKIYAHVYDWRDKPKHQPKAVC